MDDWDKLQPNDRASNLTTLDNQVTNILLGAEK